MSALVLIGLALATQVPPPELRNNSPGARPIDPALDPAIALAVAEASKAELDPKRGPGNAMEVLKAAREAQPSVDLKLRLDLRTAATMIRTSFANDKRLPPHERAARALSTFSKLDLLEPGFEVFLERAIAAAPPEVKARLTDKNMRKIRFHLAIQGGLDTAPLLAALTKRMKELGFELVKAGPTDADIVAKLSALEVRDQGGQAYVRTSLDLTRTRGPEWRKSLFRTVTAPDAKVALVAASDWLLRMGGKEMLFAWLDALGLEGVIMSMPGGHDHDEHGHGQPTRAPIAAPGAAPTPVAPKVVLPGGGKEPTPPGKK